MLVLIISLGVFAGVRTVRSVLASLRSLPRSNEDWIWY
jgi:hypothetical protein